MKMGHAASLQTQTISKQNSVEVKIIELKLLKNSLKSKISIFIPWLQMAAISKPLELEQWNFET
jgi:hypothetical protein